MLTTSKSIIITALAFGVAGQAGAAEKAPAAKTEKVPAVDPAAIGALRKMGAFLREQQSFSVRMKTETDYVLDTGQKARLWARGELKARRPDHLRAEMVSDRKERQFYYDGKTFTTYSPRMGYYAVVEGVPTTLTELADFLDDRYGLELPMVDLFRWGTNEADIESITAATYIGSTKIDGVDTDQYAFRQPGLDWQIWIQRGDQPLPRKLVLTTTDDRARPERAMELTWQLGTKLDDSQFTFVPPKDSQKIAIVEIMTPPAARAPSTRHRSHR